MINSSAPSLEFGLVKHLLLYKMSIRSLDDYRFETLPPPPTSPLKIYLLDIFELVKLTIFF